MAISFPISTADFFDQLLIQDTAVYLPEGKLSDTLKGGAQFDASLGRRLWKGFVRMGPMTQEEAVWLESRLDVLTGAGATFMAKDVRVVGPAADPDGSLLGASTPNLPWSVHSDTYEAQILNLPAGYELSVGDRFSTTYGSSPLIYGYHRVSEAGIADGTGELTVEVRPRIRSWIGAKFIQLVSPVFLAKIDTGSVTPINKSGGVWTGGDFTFTQASEILL